MKFSDTQSTSFAEAKELGLSLAEFQHICKLLERAPSFAELGVFSAMYSEHCSYKSSRRYLKRLPTTGKNVLQGPGENAGILELTKEWAIAFKMESHNHPSFIEPYQGAATGVGGIFRDIFTMGARPIAAMDFLCFGLPDDPKTALKTRSVIRGVVRGIGDYGNSVGVPTVAGQTTFHPSYALNPLVNAFCLGIVRQDGIFRGSASGVGNALIYAGSKTGRDGVRGAAMASKEFNTDAEPDRPTVQVGDPFTEKLLLEATLEAMRAGLIVGIQDMGAAGLTSSSFEMADRAATGLLVELDRVPVREQDMSAFELLLSESQERMLLVAKPENVAALRAVFDKWDLSFGEIGTVTADSRVKMTYRGETVVDLPVSLVTEAPQPERPSNAPSDLKQRWFFDRNRLFSAKLTEKIETVLADMCFADPTPLVEQYDSSVGNRTWGETVDDAAVLRIREIEGSEVSLAMSTDCNPRLCWLWPREGGRRAVAECAMNIAVRGAEPLGITDCLNFGSPENPEVLWQFQECIEGISETCEALKIPVISGNVSFYNETDGKPIYPTPAIGMVGKIEGTQRLAHSHFFSTDLELGLFGPLEAGLGGSTLAALWFGRDCGQPEETDLKLIERMMKLCQRLRRYRQEIAIHDISDGGLLRTALEMAFYSPHREVGLTLQVAPGWDADCFLFGESVGRILVAYPPSERVDMESSAGQHGIAFHPIGEVSDHGEFRVRQGGATLFQRELVSLRAGWSSRWNPLFD